jgi:hypothetical protein
MAANCEKHFDSFFPSLKYESVDRHKTRNLVITGARITLNDIINTRSLSTFKMIGEILMLSTSVIYKLAIDGYWC